MIRQALGARIHQAGGFLTIRDRNENGTVRGFEICSADGYSPRDRFLDMTGEQPRIDLEVFDRVGLEYLRQAQERSFAVLDEIGGVELLNDRFMDELARYLSGSHPCIGVMKGAGPAGKLVEAGKADTAEAVALMEQLLVPGWGSWTRWSWAAPTIRL